VNHLKAVILAAGAGTRMKSNVPKVLHSILGMSMLEYVINAAKGAGVEDICVVVGHQGDKVKDVISGVSFVEQKEQLGTGHAVMQAKDFIGNNGKTLILFGDTPLITSSTLKEMITYHNNEKNDVTVLSTIVENPEGYGRIIRDNNGTFLRSIEHKDASNEERKTKEINSGMYCFESKALQSSLDKIDNNNAQGEYYLPDTLVKIIESGGKVDAMPINVSEDIIGVNTRVQLANVTKIMQQRINEKHMLNGVTMISPETIFIGANVNIGKDTVIYPNTFIEGHSNIGEMNVIGFNTKIVDSVIGNNNVIQQSTILNSNIGSNVNIGPYAYIRPNSKISDYVKIGDFVEIKNSTIDHNTKASHLAYVGDADVGANVNFGCGTVVVNYDGVNKHRTKIEDDAFIGCNTNLVSPVVVEKGAYTAAGSTITKDVPSNSLGIARSRQVNIEEWVTKRQNKKN